MQKTVQIHNFTGIEHVQKLLNFNNHQNTKIKIQLFFIHIRLTQLLLPPTLNVAFRFFEPFPNEKLLRKKKIAATKRTIFHWKTAVRFKVQKI